MSKNEKTNKNPVKKTRFQIPKSSFIKYLENLVKQENRGALASLRRGLQHDLGHCVDMYPYIIPWIKDVKGKWEKQMHYLIAALFAFHPQSTTNGNLGDVFKKIFQSKGEAASLEQRFIAVLKSNPEDLPFHIRQAISLAKNENIPINWNELFYDLKRWPFTSKFPPYEKWAESFWRKPRKNENEE